MHHPMKDYYPMRKREESPQRGRDKIFRASEPRVQPSPKPLDPPAQDGKSASALDPFKPLTKELGVLEDKDPVLAAQAARLVALYRRMWDAYVAKHADSQRLEKENRQLESRNTSLEKEKWKIEDRYDEQRDLLSRFQMSLENVQDGITKI